MTSQHSDNTPTPTLTPTLVPTLVGTLTPTLTSTHIPAVKFNPIITNDNNKKRQRYVEDVEDEEDEDDDDDDDEDNIVVNCSYNNTNEIVSRMVNMTNVKNQHNTRKFRWGETFENLVRNIPEKQLLISPEVLEGLKKSATERFVSMCLKGINDDNVYNYYYDNDKLIDIHHNRDEPFRNACMSNNTILAQFIHELGGVDIHSRNNQAFHVTCLNQNIELAEWFNKIDSRYQFTILSDDGNKRIDINTCGFKDQQILEKTDDPATPIIEFFDDYCNDQFDDLDEINNGLYHEYHDDEYHEDEYHEESISEDKEPDSFS